MPDSAVTQSFTWVDGDPAAALPLPDRGLDFGDGLFETFLLRDGSALFADLHFARLTRGLNALGFPDCIGQAQAQLRQAEVAVAQAGWVWTALRLTLTRGAGPRGYAAPAECRPRLVATATALDRDCAVMMAPARVVSSEVQMGAQPLLAGLKHLNRLEQVLAANEARAQGADEALVFASGGAVMAVSAGNVFAVAGDRLVTPPVNRCGIAGTRREKILRDWAPYIGCAVEERELAIADIDSADELFYSNSLIGLRPIGTLGNIAWHSHPVCEQLFAAYRGEMA